MSIIESQQFIEFTSREWGFWAGVQGGGGQWSGMDGDFSLFNLCVLLYILFSRKSLFLLFFKGQLKVLEQKHAAGCQC